MLLLWCTYPEYVVFKISTTCACHLLRDITQWGMKGRATTGRRQLHVCDFMSTAKCVDVKSSRRPKWMMMGEQLQNAVLIWNTRLPKKMKNHCHSLGFKSLATPVTVMTILPWAELDFVCTSVILRALAVLAYTMIHIFQSLTSCLSNACYFAC